MMASRILSQVKRGCVENCNQPRCMVFCRTIRPAGDNFLDSQETFCMCSIVLHVWIFKCFLKTTVYYEKEIDELLCGNGRLSFNFDKKN